MWNSRSVRPQRHVEATGASWAARCEGENLPTVARVEGRSVTLTWHVWIRTAPDTEQVTEWQRAMKRSLDREEEQKERKG